MRVEQIMSRNVRTCRPEQSLAEAARIMWEQDCGCVPVTSAGKGGLRHVIGMLTDRDVCMAAYTRGLPLGELKVSAAMSQNVISCRRQDQVGVALGILKTQQLHRLPVIEGDNELIGLVSLADLAREANREHQKARPEVTDGEVGETIEGISAPRGNRAGLAPLGT